MFGNFRTAAKAVAASAVLGLGMMAALPAQADGIYLNFGDRHDPRFGIYAGDRDKGVRDWRRDRDWRRTCTPDRALDKAERMGLRHARVVDMGRNTIKVAGRKYNDRVVVVFGRERGCPIIYR